MITRKRLAERVDAAMRGANYRQLTPAECDAVSGLYVDHLDFVDFHDYTEFGDQVAV